MAAETNSSELAEAVSALYSLFAKYPHPATATGCTYCYDQAQLDYLRATPLRSLNVEMTRTLLWETADHWNGVAAYKHYLPKLLEALTPAVQLDDMYPEHIFETLAAQEFRGWPDAERAAVIGFFEALLGPEDEYELEIVFEQCERRRAALRKLREDAR